MSDETKGDEPASGPAKIAGRRWCVAVDGSHAAHNAFLTAIRFSRKEDAVTVVYAAEDRKKDYLPDDLKAAHIRERYEVELVSKFPEERFDVQILDRNGRSAKDTVCNFVNQKARDFDFLVVGCVGRKGPKLDPTVLGSTADHSLRSAHLTSIIARKPPAKTGATFVVGVDGSDRAHESFELAMSFADPSDTVLAVHIQEYNAEESMPPHLQTDGIMKRYNALAEELAESKDNATVEVRKIERASGSTSVADVLNDLAHEELAAAIFIGADGLRRFVRGGTSGWGSVSDRVVRRTRTTVVCVQPKGAIYA